MSTMIGAPLRAAPATLRGQGLVAALVLALMLAASTLLGGDFLRQQVIARAQGQSLRALAQAREALLGYAVSYEVGHAVDSRGYLPCPDAANAGSTPLGACGTRDLGVFGRLPWRTLGMADLRDGWGECLWYAVAGSIKNNPKPLSLNWDSPGQFRLLRADGSAFALDTPDQRAVAVIIAPGPALPAQTRPPSRSSGCSGGSVAVEDLPAYLEGSYSGLFAGSITLREGSSTSTDPDGSNDLIAWLTIDDIFDALRRRRDHAEHINGAIRSATALLTARVADAAFLDRHLGAPVGLLRSSLLPGASEFGLAGAERLRHDNWRDQFRFVWCADGSACIHLTHPAATSQCRGVLLFGGERLRAGAARQTRLSATERADPAQYFEGDNAANLVAGIPAFAGLAHFTVADPLQPATGDVIQCLP